MKEVSKYILIFLLLCQSAFATDKIFVRSEKSYIENGFIHRPIPEDFYEIKNLGSFLDFKEQVPKHKKIFLSYKNISYRFNFGVMDIKHSSKESNTEYVIEIEVPVGHLDYAAERLEISMSCARLVVNEKLCKGIYLRAIYNNKDTTPKDKLLAQFYEKAKEINDDISQDLVFSINFERTETQSIQKKTYKTSSDGKFVDAHEDLDRFCTTINGVKGLYVFDFGYRQQTCFLLMPYSKVKKFEGVVAYDEENDLAILYADIDNKFQVLSAPDAAQILKHAGFKCSVMDVYKLCKVGASH